MESMTVMMTHCEVLPQGFELTADPAVIALFSPAFFEF